MMTAESMEVGKGGEGGGGCLGRNGHQPQVLDTLYNVAYFLHSALLSL